MSMMIETAARRSLAAGALLVMSLGAAAAGAATLEEVVAHGSRAAVAAEQARFEAEMAAYQHSVERALKDQLRRSLAQSVTRQLRLAEAAAPHRG